MSEQADVPGVPVDPDPQVTSAATGVTGPKEPGEIGWPANATEPGDPSTPTPDYDPGHVLDGATGSDVADHSHADASAEALAEANDEVVETETVEETTTVETTYPEA